MLPERGEKLVRVVVDLIPGMSVTPTLSFSSPPIAFSQTSLPTLRTNNLQQVHIMGTLHGGPGYLDSAVRPARQRGSKEDHAWRQGCYSRWGTTGRAHANSELKHAPTCDFARPSFLCAV